MTSIALANVSKVFSGGIRALSGVSLSVEPGECLVILGPSGSGKSTILRLIAGLDPPTSGTVLLDGRSVNHLAPRERGVGFVFQNSALFPRLDVRANIGFGLRARRKSASEIARSVAETADRLGLGPLLDRLPRELSGGEARRVSLARAIAGGPRLLLLDEPFTGMDSPLRADVREHLSDLQRALRMTTVAVSHDQSDASAMADRVAVLCRGELRQSGSYLDLYESPADRFVAGFVGEPSRNLVPGKVRVLDGARFFEADSGIASGEIPPMTESLSDGQPVELGIRPDEIDLEPRGDGLIVKGEVSRVEPRGRESLVTLRTETESFKVLMPPARVERIGTRVSYGIDPSRIRWFRPPDGVPLR